MLGGGLGALTRFLVTDLIGIRWFPNFPIESLIINLSGCLVMGFLFSLLKEKISDFLKAFIFIGFLGSYTTFSDFTFQTNNFIMEGWVDTALLNIGLSLISGILVFCAAYYLAEKVKIKRN